MPYNIQSDKTVVRNHNQRLQNVQFGRKEDDSYDLLTGNRRKKRAASQQNAVKYDFIDNKDGKNDNFILLLLLFTN